MGKQFSIPLDLGVQKREFYPVQTKNGPVTYAIVEVGCKRDKKRAQVQKHKENFLNAWNENPHKSPNINHVPDVLKYIAHFDDMGSIPRDFLPYSADGYLFLKYVPDDFILNITPLEKVSLFETLNSKYERRFVSSLLNKNNYLELYAMIVSSNDDNSFCRFRGRVAELLVQKSIDSVISSDIIQKNNVSFLSDGSGDAPSEIDILLQFYNKNKISTIMGALGDLDHISVTLTDSDALYYHRKRYLNKSA